MGPTLVVSWLSGLFSSRQPLPGVRGSDGRATGSVGSFRRGALVARARSPDRADPWRVRLPGLQGLPRHLLSHDSWGRVLPPRDLLPGRGTVVKAALLPRRCRLLRRTMATPGALPPWDRGITSLGPRSQDGGSGVRSSYPPLRGAAEALSRQAFRRRSCTPVRLRHSSGSSSDAYATVLPTEVDRTRTGPGPDQDRTRTGPGPDQDRTRIGPGPDQTRPDRTGPDQGRTRDGDRTRPDQTGSSWFPGPDRDLSERRDARHGDRRSRARKRGHRDASLSSDSDYRREWRRDRHRRRHGRSRHRNRSVTPPQAASLATDQILHAIADVKRATDAVVARVDSLERGGAVSAAASPPPSLFEQDISLGPAQDELPSLRRRRRRRVVAGGAPDTVVRRRTPRWWPRPGPGRR